MATFTVEGPYEISYEQKAGGRVLNFSNFWAGQAADVADSCGCYVFAIRSGGGEMPLYVGKATKSFRQETFNPANRHKYHQGFSDYSRGTPIVYFIVHSPQRGKVNASQIGKIEDFLIQTGVAKNELLQNVRGRSTPEWSISGVVRGGRGRQSHAAAAFTRLFGISRRR